MVMGGRVYWPRPLHFDMARAISSVVILWCQCFCWWLAELPPPRPWPTSNWSLEDPHHDHHCDLRCMYMMPKHRRRLRGKPQRGSPWRPRRPSFFSRDMSSSAPSCHLQEPQPSHTPPAPQIASLNSLELIPRSPCSSLGLLLAPTGTEPQSTQRSAFPSTLGEEPPPPKRASGSSGTSSVDATTSEQVKDKLGILYGLVFELRQGVEDLQFRLQLSNDKVTLFLQLLSSLHETFLSAPIDADTADGEAKESATPTQAQGTATTTGDVVMQGAAEPSLKVTGSATVDEQDIARHDRGVEKKEEVEMQWGDGTAIIEEEPWTGDLDATWPGYAPSV